MNSEEFDEKLSSESEHHHQLKLRCLTEDDFDDIKEIMDKVYPSMDGGWKKSQFFAQLKQFPDGQFCIEDKGKVVAVAQSIIVSYDRYGDRHNYETITGNGEFSTHDAHGDTLYGVDIFVDPDHRGLRLGRRLYDARKKLCEELNLKRIIAGGRIPGYRDHADRMSVKEYIAQVISAKIHDPVLTFQLKNDFHVKSILTNYIPKDADSHSHATLLEWINIWYEKRDADEPVIHTKSSIARVGAVQWQMRRVNTLSDLIEQINFFVDAVAGYNVDFCLFPEFFNGAMMAESNDKHPAAAIRHLASHTTEIREAMLEMAVSYNINIIAGSMPELYNDKLYNISYLLRRDGSVAFQRKLHITPDEKMYWGLEGGDKLTVFDTDAGKIGVLVCYDVEFPELSRILADQGVQILFVPYWTDTKNSYLRVRRCAQSRAIENECYVVITGSVGNLPNVENMDIQYSQAAVFSPADFAFPHDAVIAEATPNTEMTLISDLDLDLLKTLRFAGAVRNTQDRRKDLYAVQWLGIGS